MAQGRCVSQRRMASQASAEAQALSGSVFKQTTSRSRALRLLEPWPAGLGLNWRALAPHFCRARCARLGEHDKTLCQAEKSCCQFVCLKR